MISAGIAVKGSGQNCILVCSSTLQKPCILELAMQLISGSQLNSIVIFNMFKLVITFYIPVFDGYICIDHMGAILSKSE